jgi:hypothetical protein
VGGAVDDDVEVLLLVFVVFDVAAAAIGQALV